MALNEDVVQAVANANFKAMAEAGVQDFLSHTARLRILAEKSLGTQLEKMGTISAQEGLGAAIAATPVFQQASKTAGNTPPVTP